MLLSFVKMGLVYPEKPQKPRRVRAAHGAKNFNYFLPRHVRGKKYFSAQQVPKARSGPQSLWQKKRSFFARILKLRVAHRAGMQLHVADVADTRQVHHHALEAQTEAGVTARF